MGLPDCRYGLFFQHLSSRVLRIGFDAKGHHGLISLHPAQKNIGDLRPFIDTHQEQARGKGIEGAKVTDFLGA